jgi:hypothetical protein
MTAFESNFLEANPEFQNISTSNIDLFTRDFLDNFFRR